MLGRFRMCSPRSLILGAESSPFAYFHRNITDEARQKLEKMVKNKNVVVFMKGVPSQPMCGFSNAVVQILNMHGVKDYDAHNVLADESMRNDIKEFANWPTIPQVFFNGEFIGGCDILLQMHQSGELVKELEKIGIRSALLDKEKAS